ncbi:MBL fold metallo-hydrolase [Paenibacillus thalictri]|uniref:MBL fold metallo-hydrolase n=1 Tax=Paenibacillus thalictri TaxID=2527873 RepID=A0A4Q9DJ18_9BACL|nr:MBL fold metallo-hydrolase [Paenibacillus thalictri]TBL73891.1 MBL fold metallo-hydrolase [Paenibacillus thalictri]
MKIHFLGTAAAEGFPNSFCQCEACAKAWELGGKNIRTRSSAIIDDVLKFDYSPDSYMQALRDKLNYGRLEHLIVTHTHADHYNPADLFCRVEGFAHGLRHPLHLYGNDSVMSKGRSALGRFDSSQFVFHLLRPFQPFAAGDATITPLLADHDKFETCLLYVIEKDGKRVLYGHDTGWFPEATWEWLKGKRLDFAILDCTHGYTSNNRNPNHMGVETIFEVQRVFREEGVLAGDGQIAVTHFTHNSGLLHDDFIGIFEPAGILVAYDSLVVHI